MRTASSIFWNIDAVVFNVLVALVALFVILLAGLWLHDEVSKCRAVRRRNRLRRGVITQ